ncbi:MAG: hypothetical protein ACR2GK_07390 [Gemmatimonadaceae bacterium]
MLFEIAHQDGTYTVVPNGLAPSPPSNVGLLEKHIEHWLAGHPEILLPGEQVLVIAQSISGQSMADILALDSSGRLVVVEIKRDWSSRETVGQLLEYAAKLSDCGYAFLEGLARKYKRDDALNLFAKFQEIFPDSPAQRDELGQTQRILVVAPEADESLRSIVAWLTRHRVPIQFVPFTVYAGADKVPRFLSLDGAPVVAERQTTNDSWAGHWIFNTNESYAPGAYQRMFERNVAAIYGYPNGPQNIEGARKDDLVLAYVNQQGLRAVGRVVDGHVASGEGVFLDASGAQQPGEFHLAVRWEALVNPAHAISAREASTTFGYILPVRSVFGKLHHGKRAAALEKELRAKGGGAPAV